MECSCSQAFGPGFRKEGAGTIEASERAALIGDRQVAVDEFVDEDWTAHVVATGVGSWQLEHKAFKGDGAVAADDPLVLNGEQELEVHTRYLHESALRLRGLDGEAAI